MRNSMTNGGRATMTIESDCAVAGAGRMTIAVQFLCYAAIGGLAAIVNLLLFLALRRAGISLPASTLTAFFVAAAVNYYLSVKLLFRHQARWNAAGEIVVFLAVVGTVATFDLYCTRSLIGRGMADGWAKIISTGLGLVLNFTGRKYLVFPETSRREKSVALIP